MRYIVLKKIFKKCGITLGGFENGFAVDHV